MAQADQSIQNATFPTVRADINNNLAALFSDSSGNTAPTVTVAFQDWIDTSGADAVWKKRNAANNAWITVGTIDGNDIAFEGTLPSQSGQSGNYLTTNGTDASWGAIPPGSSGTIFTSSGTWTKPTTGTLVYVEIWSGGGGGARADSSGGGGGGGFMTIILPFSLFSATETVTIGAGGAGRTTALGNGSGVSGGTSSLTVGSTTTLSVTGGSAGVVNPGSGANGGAGTISAVINNTGGNGGTGSDGGSVTWAGGGGGGRNSATIRAGGTSIFGGAGGAGGGTLGLAGGDGVILAGGGGAAREANAGSGARGEIRIYVW
jgi:hypothetical protein